MLELIGAPGAPLPGGGLAGLIGVPPGAPLPGGGLAGFIGEPPPPPVEAKCMDNNNSVVEIDGTKYNIRCELQIRDKPIVGSGPAATFTDCLKMCNNNNDCKSADFWDPTGSKTCYLFDSPNEPAYTSGTNWAAYVA